MDILYIKESTDGGAMLTVEMTKEEHDMLLELGFVEALKEGTKSMKEVNPQPIPQPETIEDSLF